MTPVPPTDKNESAAGSPPSGEPAFLAVGKLRRPHGIGGEIIMDLLTDFPERLEPGVMLYVTASNRNERQPIVLRSLRWHGQAVLVSFEGYDTLEEVGEFRNQVVYVKADDRPVLEEGEYYHHQILGLRVVEENGEVVGVIKDILETGANDVYVVRPEKGPELLIPYTEEVVQKIDLEAGEMRIVMLPGLRGKIE